jgi:hypothetical protein
VAVAGLAAAASLAIGGFVVWPSGGEPAAAAVVRDAVDTLEEFTSYQVIGSEFEPGVGRVAWTLRVSGDDVSYASRAVLADGRVDMSGITYLDDTVYTTADGQTEVRPRQPVDNIDTRFHDLYTALTAALDGADVTEAMTETFHGVEMTRYYVALTERSFASLSAGGGIDIDPGNIEELRVCVADGHHVHELHLIYRDGRTIDVTLSDFDGAITIRPPDGASVA